MPTTSSVGLVGFGRIGRFLAERIAAEAAISLDYVYTRELSGIPDQRVDAALISDQSELVDRSVDLTVEAAHADFVAEFGEDVLASNDLMVLSTTALADTSLEDQLVHCCESMGTTLYVPHGAVLGTDGLQDGQSSLDTVSITTCKPPANIDFSAAAISKKDIEDRTTLYDGPTREICRRYPRNVNSHATVALAGLGFDKTKSTLIADPSMTEATHHIVAKGKGTRLEINRSSSIDGVTGSYTLDSLWGSISRVLSDDSSIAVI